jgi:biotin transport system substrate-specific component
MEAESHPTCRRALAAMGLGSLIIYTLGLLQLSVWLDCTLRQGLMLGVLPFLPGDLIKIAAAVLICRKAGFVAFANPTEIRE